MNNQRWLIYALGGGYGHFTRALSLARAAKQVGQTVEILFNSKLAINLIEHHLRDVPNLHLTPISPELSKDQVARLINDRLLTQTNYRVLIVDTFLRGLGGELKYILPQLKVPKILVHRDLNPKYLSSFDSTRAVNLFDQILIPGESAHFDTHKLSYKTPPWLLCGPGEVLTSQEARQALRVPTEDKRSIVAFMGSGTQAEIAQSLEYAVAIETQFPQLNIRKLVLGHDAEHSVAWPALRVLTAIDLLICSGGYNTVHEARATKTPFLAFPQPRLYDQQAKRLDAHETVETFAEVIAACAHLEARQSRRNDVSLNYINGAEAAVSKIQEISL